MFYAVPSNVGILNFSTGCYKRTEHSVMSVQGRTPDK